MLSLFILKYHCRTCLIELEVDGEIDDEDSSETYFSMYKNPNVYKLIRLCLGKNDEDDELDIHMPNLCSSCFFKWDNFVNHCDLAVQSDDTLRSGLEPKKPPRVDFYEIEKFESDSPYYEYEDVSLSKSSSPYKYKSAGTDGITTNKSLDNTQKPLIKSNECHYITSSSNELSRNTYNTCNNNHIAVQKSRKKKLPEETAKLVGKKLKLYPGPMPTYKRQKKNLIVPEEASKMSDKDLINYKEPTAAEEYQTCSDINNATSNTTTTYRCETCEMYFYESHKYEAHIKKVHEFQKSPYQCPNCTKNYRYYKLLIEHMNERHSMEPRSYICGYCIKTFNLSRAYLNHMKLHSISPSPDEEDCKPITIKCDQCTFVAPTKKMLDTHKKYKHTTSKCGECSKEFKCQYTLKCHFTKYHGPVNTDFQCPECKLMFSSQAALNVHQVSHLNTEEVLVLEPLDSREYIPEDDQCLKKVYEILEEAADGRLVLATYKEKGTLSPEHRKYVVRKVVQHYMENLEKITVAKCRELAYEILEVFPNECLETYYAQPNKSQPPKGKLWDRYQGQRRNLRKVEAGFNPGRRSTNNMF